MCVCVCVCMCVFYANYSKHCTSLMDTRPSCCHDDILPNGVNEPRRGGLERGGEIDVPDVLAHNLAFPLFLSFSFPHANPLCFSYSAKHHGALPRPYPFIVPLSSYLSTPFCLRPPSWSVSPRCSLSQANVALEETASLRCLRSARLSGLGLTG